MSNDKLAIYNYDEIAIITTDTKKSDFEWHTILLSGKLLAIFQIMQIVEKQT